MSGDIKHNVKMEGVKVKIKRVTSPDVESLYRKVLKIICDSKTQVTCQQFASMYGLCNINPYLKHLKLG
jgi:hypothetical protein